MNLLTHHKVSSDQFFRPEVDPLGAIRTLAQVATPSMTLNTMSSESLEHGKTNTVLMSFISIVLFMS